MIFPEQRILRSRTKCWGEAWVCSHDMITVIEGLPLA